MANFKIVVTDYEYKTFEPEKHVFDPLGMTITYEQCRTEEEVIEKCRDADALLNQYAPLSRKVIEQLDACKVISRYGIGVNTVDIDAATEKGIVVANVTDYCLDEVSDHAMAMLLACNRKVVLLNQDVKKGKWDFNVAAPIPRLRGQTLGLLGFGNIPRTLARKAKAFGLTVIAYDPFVSPEVASQEGVTLLDKESVYQQADYLSVHLPLNTQTEGFVDKAAFRQMKNSAQIINTARGPVIDEKAMIEALQEGEIAGAGLDVVTSEPIEQDNPLLAMDQVILNPHAAFYSEEAGAELKSKAAQNVADVLSGTYPDYLVNREVRKQLSLADKA